MFYDRGLPELPSKRPERLYLATDRCRYRDLWINIRYSLGSPSYRWWWEESSEELEGTGAPQAQNLLTGTQR